MYRLFPTLACLLFGGFVVVPGPTLAAAVPVAGGVPVDVVIDAGADRHPISPLIYGVNFGTTALLKELNAPLNRSGGDSASLFNWRLDARNAGKDWYFESLRCTDDIFDQYGDGFVAQTRAGGARPMLTIPMIGWVAKLDPAGRPLASFAIGNYGLQQASDLSGFADAGNGIAIDGAEITDNDPNDAAIPDTADDEKQWLRHLVARWGGAASGGVPYYILDNEPSAWHRIHRDVQPVGARARDIAVKVEAYAAMVKSVDPQGKVVAPEEWGWGGYRYSGYDQQYAVHHGFDAAPDRREQTDGMDYLPWLLTQWKAAGHPVDVVSVHYYPQGGEYGDNHDDVSPEMQLLRNRSTRDLWDPHYRNTTWINDTVMLIPRLRHWVDTDYDPHTPIAITEYNWGGEASMNGATTEADILGIFGREGLDIANRWAAPASGSPTFLAMKLYRNYDGQDGGFGDTSIAARVPDPDAVSAFAALRAADGAMTIMVINKQLATPAEVRMTLGHFADHGSQQAYQLAEGQIDRLAPGTYSDGVLGAALPAQSVTLFVLHGVAR